MNEKTKNVPSETLILPRTIERIKTRSQSAKRVIEDYDPAPETIYETVRESKAEDFLLGETALDLLDSQRATQTIELDQMRKDAGGDIKVGVVTLPRKVTIAGRDLIIEKMLGYGAFGFITQTKDAKYVVKFISTDSQDDQLLQHTARELTSLSRFNPLPDSDQRIIRGIQQATPEDRQTGPEKNKQIPGFLGATRITMKNPDGYEEEFIAIAMERVDGIGMDAFMNQQSDVKKLRPSAYVGIISDIAKALAPFHAHRLLHRDLKPGNVIINFDETGKADAHLVDMGLMTDQDYLALELFEDLTMQQLKTVILALREKLLNMSLDHEFDETGERAWLELSALFDRVLQNEQVSTKEISKILTQTLSQLSDQMKEFVEDEIDQQPTQTPRSGTLRFMDSDSLIGHPTKASDIFALGLTIAHFLSYATERRKQPKVKPGTVLMQLADRNFFKRPEVISELGGGKTGKAVGDLIASMIDPDPGKRPQNAQEVLEKINAIPANEDI